MKKLSPSGRVARSAEKGRLSLFYAIEPKVFPLCGVKHKSKKLNWEKVARMRRKRGASRLEISDKVLDNQLIDLFLLFNPLLF